MNKIDPELLFFSRPPNDLHAHVPLASSLQNFESALLLLALARYPHALVTCVSAIESAFHAGLHPRPKPKASLQDLLTRAATENPTLRTFSPGDLVDLRDKRNYIVHFGFSPQDDSAAARLLLRVALPYLESCYQEFFGLNIRQSLNPDLAEHLELAIAMYAKFGDLASAAPEHWFAAVRHWVRSFVNMSAAGDWEEALVEADTSGTKWELVHKMVDVELAARLRWPFDCPMCGDTATFVCDLNETLPRTDAVRLGRGHCPSCGFFAPADVRILTEALCANQKDRQQSAILQDLGSPLLWGPE